MQDGEPIQEAYGPVITDNTSPFYCGASVGSNNTAELQAWMEVALFLLATPPKEVTFFYDSKWMANMVRGQARPKRHKQMVVNSRAILSKLAETTTVHWRWVKGHQGDEYNTKADELAHKGKGSLEAQGGRYALDNPVTVFDVIFPPSPPTGSLNNKLQKIISALRQAEIKSFSVNKATPRQPWLPPELARDLETAKRTQANLDPEYSTYYKEVKKRARADKRLLIDTTGYTAKHNSVLDGVRERIIHYSFCAGSKITPPERVNLSTFSFWIGEWLLIRWTTLACLRP